MLFAFMMLALAGVAYHNLLVVPQHRALPPIDDEETWKVEREAEISAMQQKITAQRDGALDAIVGDAG